MEQKNKELNQDLKFGLKSFITTCLVLLAVIIFVGVLTFVVRPGTYLTDANGNVLPDSFKFIESTSRLPVWRWFTAPFEALIIGEGNINIIQIIAVLLVLGGTFKVLDKTGGLYAIVQLIVEKFYNKRYALIWTVTLFMMLLSSCFGLQEELLIMFPLFLSMASAMGWSKEQAISLILISTGVGFTAAMFNPFTVGVASSLAGVSVLDGVWYRVLIFALLYVITSLYLIDKAKRDEKLNPTGSNVALAVRPEEEKREDAKKAKMVGILFLTVLAVIIIASSVPFIADLGLGMVFMAVAFVIGTFVIGKTSLGSFKKTFKIFCSGAKDLAPSIVIVLLAFSVKYIAERGNILHTIFYYCHSFIVQQSPYLAVILLYVLVLLIEFFIPGSLSKALLLIPLLTLAPIPGISKNIIILIFLFGDGYTNVLYPTCGTLVVGLSLAKVSYVKWIKRTILFQLFLFVLSILFLLFAVYIGF